MLMAIDGVGMRFTRYSGSPVFTFLKLTLTLALFGGILGAIGSVQSRPKLDVKVSELGLMLSGENVDFSKNLPKISVEEGCRAILTKPVILDFNRALAGILIPDSPAGGADKRSCDVSVKYGDENYAFPKLIELE
jgi:hypothetical protein